MIGPFLGGRARRRIVVGLAEKTPAETMSTVMQSQILKTRCRAHGTIALAMTLSARPGLHHSVNRGHSAF